MEALRAELRRAREEWEAEVPTFYRAGPGARERALLRPGPMQRKVLAALWHVPDPVDGGLPRAAVAQIVGGDAGSVRRAVRSLLRAGRLEASECGRVRLSRQEAFWFDLRARAGLLFEEEPDAEHARAVLRRFGWEVPDERARKGDTRCVGAAPAKLGANDNHGKA